MMIAIIIFDHFIYELLAQCLESFRYLIVLLGKGTNEYFLKK